MSDIPIFTGGDSEPENYFPFDINSEMCLADELNRPVIKQEVIQKEKRDARHKLITNYRVASQVKVEYPPEWYTIYGIGEVTDADAMEIWIGRARVDHFIILHPKMWDTCIYGFNKYCSREQSDSIVYFGAFRSEKHAIAVRSTKSH